MIDPKAAARPRGLRLEELEPEDARMTRFIWDIERAKRLERYLKPGAEEMAAFYRRTLRQKGLLPE